MTEENKTKILQRNRKQMKMSNKNRRALPHGMKIGEEETGQII